MLPPVPLAHVPEFANVVDVPVADFEIVKVRAEASLAVNVAPPLIVRDETVAS